MRIPCFTLCAFLLAGTCMAQNSSQPVVAGELGTRIDDYMKRLSAHGLSGALLVSKDGEVIVHKGYGLADRQRKLPITTDMLFNIGSLGKQFTAAAILKLEMQGKLATGDTLGKFFPNAPKDKRGITLHQLLTHSAGFPYLWAAPPHALKTSDEIVNAILEQPLDTEPGTKFAYSNPGYSLLGRIIERVAGTSYQNYLRNNLFEPAGMTRTGFEGDSDRWNGGLALHSYSDSQDEGALEHFDFGEQAVGAGTVISTVGDLYKWELALRGERILSDAAKRKLFTPHVSVGGPLGYGYGWNVGPTPRKTTVMFHAGDIAGYNAEYRRYPDENFVVIFTSNMRVGGKGYRQAIMNNLVFLITGGKYPEPPVVTELPAETLRKYEGNYQLPSGEKLMAWRDENRLIIGANGQEGIALLAGADSAARSMEKEFSRRTAAVVEGFAHDRSEALRENLHPSVPFEGTWVGARAAWQAYEDSLGKFKRVEVIGTAVFPPASARTYVRLHMERGTIMEMYGWADGKLTAADNVFRAAMETSFAPESGTDAASYDIFSGRTLRITFDAEGKSLVVHSPTGDIRARRTGA